MSRRASGASWNDVRRIALGLPESSEQSPQGRARWLVRDKAFAWERPLRPVDILALGERAPAGPILAVRVGDLLVKEALLAGKTGALFTTPHFDGHPSVLIRLDRIPLAQLEDLIVEAWLARAPKRLVRDYLAVDAPRSRRRPRPGTATGCRKAGTGRRRRS